MTPILRRRRVLSLLDDFLQRRRVHRQDAMRASRGEDCARTALAEMIAATAVLDFGAFPLKP